MRLAENKVDADAALQRILDATIQAGGVLGDSFNLDRVWEEIVQCVLWASFAQTMSSSVHADRKRRLKHIVDATQVIQREMAALGWGNIARVKDLEHFAEERLERAEASRNAAIKEPACARALSFSALSVVVGQLVAPFERAFPASSKYTTVDSETRGPFIAFAEATFREFGITKDGNAPYMRRSIADALNEFKKLPRPQLRRKTTRRT